MPEVPKLIQVERKGGQFKLLIDGQEFPWHLSADGGVDVEVHNDTIPSINVTLMAERVEVVDQV